MTPWSRGQWLPFDGAATQVQLTRVVQYPSCLRRALSRCGIGRSVELGRREVGKLRLRGKRLFTELASVGSRQGGQGAPDIGGTAPWPPRPHPLVAVTRICGLLCMCTTALGTPQRGQTRRRAVKPSGRQTARIQPQYRPQVFIQLRACFWDDLLAACPNRSATMFAGRMVCR